MLKKHPCMGAVLFQLFVVVMSLVVPFSLDIHLFIEGRLQISAGLIGKAE